MNNGKNQLFPCLSNPSSLSQPSDSSDPDAASAISDHYLVELSALMASGQDNIGTEMRTFAEHLKPYPHLILQKCMYKTGPFD